MKVSTKKVLVGSGILAAASTAVVGAVKAIRCFQANTLVKVAVDRNGPKVMDKAQANLSGSVGDAQAEEQLNAAAEKLRGRDLETVEIDSYDGEKLVGHWWPCEEPKRIVIAMHGWRSSWARDFGTIADFWHDQHCNVLFAEQRGQGNSGGAYMGFGMMERLDCMEWIRWVNEHGGKELPIYLGGVSMGAATVLMTAGLDLPPNVHGIVADSGYTAPQAIWKHVMEKNLHISYNTHRSNIDTECKRKINMRADECSCTEAMQKCRVPVLFIHGTDDHFVPIEMTYENYKACAAPKRLFIVPGAEHCMSYSVDREGYEKALKEFWNDFDAWRSENSEEKE